MYVFIQAAAAAADTLEQCTMCANNLWALWTGGEGGSARADYCAAVALCQSTTAAG
jgi:hypothetical protein